jgi:hypothetical protein
VDTVTGALVNPIDPGILTLAEDTTHLLNTPRAYYALLTNQGQFETPFPPPPEEPVCGDVDGDGHADAACGGDDCDDTDPNVHPGADEVCDNAIDDDCDTFADCEDLDAPLAGCLDEPICRCEAVDGDEDGHATNANGCGDDCDDRDADNFPGNPETCADAGDNDCDTLVDCFDPDCAGDPACDCVNVVDGDGDGQLAPPCGLDCNDGDGTICADATLCPEVQCDGIDQDCTGADQCIIIEGGGGGFPAPLGGGGGFGPLGGGGPPRVEPNNPIVLIACNGDESYVANSNQGVITIEITNIDRTTGELVGWTTQSQGLPGGQKTHGHDALLYFGFLYDFLGVSGESANSEPNTAQGGYRFPFDEAETGNGFLDTRQNSGGAKLTSARGYYGLVRLNAKIYAFGGNDGSGATTAIDQNTQ